MAAFQFYAPIANNGGSVDFTVEAATAEDARNQLTLEFSRGDIPSAQLTPTIQVFLALDPNAIVPRP